MTIFRRILWVTFILLGAIVLTTVHAGTASAAKPSTPLIGFVDYTYLINQNPDTPKANEALQAEKELAQKEYNEKSGILNDKGKQDLLNLLNQRVEQKRLELLKPIMDKINEAIKQVADAKGLAVVLYKNTVAYGGVDITQDVADKLKKK